MPNPVDRLRRLLPTSLTGLAGAVCAACCVLPLLLAAGILAGGGWATLTRFLPGTAVALAGLAGLSWWWAARRGHRAGCAGGDCACRPGGKIATVRSDP